MGVSRVVQWVVFIGVFLALLPAAVWAGDKCSCHCQTDDHHVYADSEMLAEPLMYRNVEATLHWKTADAQGNMSKTYELGAGSEADLEYCCAGVIKDVEFKVTVFDQDTHVCETGARYDVFAKLLEQSSPYVKVTETGDSIALGREGSSPCSGVWKGTWTPADQDGDGTADTGVFHFTLEGEIEDDHSDHSKSNDPPKGNSDSDKAKASVDLTKYSAVLTLIRVESVEYCRADKDSSSESDWDTSVYVAAGGKNTDVHKTDVRITIEPAVSGATIVAEKNGGNGDVVAAVFAQQSSTTDSDGRVYGTYTSSDKLEDATIKVVQCQYHAVDIDPGSTITQEWDIAGDYDFEFPSVFVPEEPDDVSFYPTLDVVAAEGAIDKHSMEYYTTEATLYYCSWNLETDEFEEKEITVTYPNYTGIPFGQTIDTLIQHSQTSEKPLGVYTNAQKVHDYWDYDTETGIFRLIEPQSYSFSAYDTEVVDK